MFSDIEQSVIRYQVYRDAALAITKGNSSVDSICVRSDGSISKQCSSFQSVPESIYFGLKYRKDITDKFVLFYSQVSNHSFDDYQTIVLTSNNGFDEYSTGRDALVNVATNSVRIEKIFGHSIWVENKHNRSYFFMRNDSLPCRPMVAVGLLNWTGHTTNASVVSLAAKVFDVNPF